MLGKHQYNFSSIFQDRMCKKKKIMTFVLFKWNLSGNPEAGEVLATDFRYMDSLGLLGY